MSLPNSGAVSYNGISFVEMYRSKCEVKPVKDSAGRALVVREYTLDVDARIATPAGTTTDATLAAMRIALEKPAGQLVYTLKGFGPLQVNVPGGVRDAAYGPWPQVLSWDPVGNNQGCAVRWKCTTVIPCEENPADQGVIEYCWSESWDIDQHGFTSRTIEGHVVVQATRPTVNARTVPDNADRLREQVTPELPTGFRRTQSFQLSEDKRTLQFSFKDEELPQPLPSGTTDCEVTHRARWTLPRAGVVQWLTSTLSGTIYLPVHTPRQYAWNKIFLIMRSKWPLGGGGGLAGVAGGGAALAAIQAIAGGVAGNAGGAQPRAGVGATFFLSDVEVSDELFGNAVHFSASCWIKPNGANVGPSRLLDSTGLWSPIANTDYVAWKKSISKVLGPRGVAGMGFENADDAIVDLCSRENVHTGSPQTSTRSLVGNGQIPRQPNGGVILPQNSWIAYRLRIKLIEDDRAARHKPLTKGASLKPVPPPDGSIINSDYQKSPGLQPPQDNELGGAIDSGPDVDIGVQSPGFTGGVPDVIQQVSTPTLTLRLEGDAARIGYPVPTPRLTSVGNVPVTQLRQKVSQEQVGTIGGGVPIFKATWQIDYALPIAGNANLPMPLNPPLE